MCETLDSEHSLPFRRWGWDRWRGGEVGGGWGTRGTGNVDTEGKERKILRLKEITKYQPYTFFCPSLSLFATYIKRQNHSALQSWGAVKT